MGCSVSVQSGANVIFRIRVFEADMEDLMKGYSNYKTVAFAHCISSDFDSSGQECGRSHLPGNA